MAAAARRPDLLRITEKIGARRRNAGLFIQASTLQIESVKKGFLLASLTAVTQSCSMLRFFNISIFVLAALSVVVWLWFPAQYFALVQEDSILEWMTFWAFFAAGMMYVVAAYRSRSQGVREIWFPMALSAGCLLIAMEEISWGQRIFYFQPPEALLARNIQGEANLHNLASPSVLFWGFVAMVALYGIILPLCLRDPKLSAMIRAFGISAPPGPLMPSFILIIALCFALPSGASQLSPVPYSNEVIELLCAFVFLASALGHKATAGFSSQRIAIIVGLVILLGSISSSAISLIRKNDPSLVCLALREMEAMRVDFYHQVNSLPRSPGLDLRVSTFVGYGNVPRLRNGAFSERAAAGEMAHARAVFFLDPWNQPYWVSDRYMDDGSRVMFVYSHGPNARSDLSVGRSSGDDFGIVLTFSSQDDLEPFGPSLAALLSQRNERCI